MTSPESREKYARYIAEMSVSEQASLQPSTAPSAHQEISIGELIVADWEFATVYYGKDGKPAKQRRCMLEALQPLRDLYVSTQASSEPTGLLVDVRPGSLARQGSKPTFVRGDKLECICHCTGRIAAAKTDSDQPSPSSLFKAGNLRGTGRKATGGIGNVHSLGSKPAFVERRNSHWPRRGTKLLQQLTAKR